MRVVLRTPAQSAIYSMAVIYCDNVDPLQEPLSSLEARAKALAREIHSVEQPREDQRERRGRRSGRRSEDSMLERSIVSLAKDVKQACVI
jgi:hypothetical protein